jgi:hypothetical protein
MLKLKIYKEDISDMVREVRDMRSWCKPSDGWYLQATLVSNSNKYCPAWVTTLEGSDSRTEFDDMILYVKLRPWKDATYDGCLRSIITEVDEKLIDLSEYSSEYGKDMASSMRYYEALRAKLEELR